MDSPALSVTSDMTDEELDQYFASYVPLSNLPTPPPAKEELPITNTVETTKSCRQRNTSELEAQSTHLANLVPRNVSTLKPNTTIIRGFLERAGLPVEIVAFAACVLDALSQRFATSWRDACFPTESYFAPRTNFRQQSPANPDVVVLAALSLAQGFVEDCGRSNERWARVCAEQFTSREIDTTKTCILKDMDYGLFRITPEMVQSMVRDCQRASSSSVEKIDMRRLDISMKEERRPKLALSTGEAVWANGVQTPELTP